MKKSHIVFGVIGVAIVALYLVGLQTRLDTKPNVKSVKSDISKCTETNTKADNLGNVFTCIGGEWIYTGTNNENKG